MNDLQKSAEHWRSKVAEPIKVIYQVKDGALGSPFGPDARWHGKLSNVTAELGLLDAWLDRLGAPRQHDDKMSGPISRHYVPGLLPGVRSEQDNKMKTPGHRPGVHLQQECMRIRR
jgi:hypothetical protein